MQAVFRQYLSWAGTGAGPWYGILAPDQIRAEVELDRDILRAEIVEGDVTGDPLLTHFWTVLILRGDLAGTVWDTCDGWHQPIKWWPADELAGPDGEDRGAVRAPVDFLSWGERWREDAPTRTA